MNKKSELDCYLYFMWNEWSIYVCRDIFGVNLGNHIWAKWCRYCECHGAIGAPARLYSELDSDNRKILVEYAFNHYNRA